ICIASKSSGLMAVSLSKMSPAQAFDYAAKAPNQVARDYFGRRILSGEDVRPPFQTQVKILHLPAPVGHDRQCDVSKPARTADHGELRGVAKYGAGVRSFE